MICAADLTCLPYTPDLTQAGIVYALRWLANRVQPQESRVLGALRQVTAEKAAELAFRRCLQAQNVPHETRQVTPFTEPERWDVLLGGWRCDLRCTLLRRERLVRRVVQHPGELLQAAAAAPAEHRAAEESWTGHDIYLFAFVLGQTSPRWPEPPSWLVHGMPLAWRRPATWTGLGRLALKSEHPGPLLVELGGQAENRAFLRETVTLIPGERAWVLQPFYSLAYLHVPALPEGRVAVSSPRLRRVGIVSPRRWGDLWLRGEQVILAGWMPRAEFLRRAHLLPVGSRLQQEACTPGPCRALPVAELYPLGELFACAQAWRASGR